MKLLNRETANRNRARPKRRLPRLLSCIRWDEVFVLQGAPLIGANFSIPGFTRGNIVTLAIFVVASCCLVAHVYALNDWAGIQGDLRDPNRAARTFTTKGVSRTELGVLVTVLLGVSLLLFAFTNGTSLMIAMGIAGLGALYSAPMFLMKGHPVFSSLLHLVGGTLHFLLGYSTFAALNARSVAIGLFFGLVFTAGHFTHEARDRDADLVNGIRTNAVAFGRTQGFFAGLALFTTAYALLITLAVLGAVPPVLVCTAALYCVHLYSSVRTLRDGLSFESLSRLQGHYRVLYAVIGVAMLVAVRVT